MASRRADRLHEIPSHCERICRNRKLPETQGQEADRRQDRPDSSPDQSERRASTDGRRSKHTRRRGESLISDEGCFQSAENNTKEARPLHENFAGIDGDDGLLKEPPDDPKGASFDDLRNLHLEKDQLYQAQEDYYHPLRLQILARYRRMHMSYSSAVRVVGSRTDSDRNGEVIMKGKGTVGRKRKRSTDDEKDRRPRA